MTVHATADTESLLLSEINPADEDLVPLREMLSWPGAPDTTQTLRNWHKIGVMSVRGQRIMLPAIRVGRVIYSTYPRYLAFIEATNGR